MIILTTIGFYGRYFFEYSMKQRIFKTSLIILSLFVGLTALYGGTLMLLYPQDGGPMQMGAVIQYFQVLPLSKLLFQNFIFPGISLLLVNCLTQVFSFFMIVKSNKKAALYTLISAILLMLWICIQFIILPSNPLSTFYFIVGLIEAVISLLYFKEQRKV